MLSAGFQVGHVRHDELCQRVVADQLFQMGQPSDIGNSTKTLGF